MRKKLCKSKRLAFVLGAVTLATISAPAHALQFTWEGDVSNAMSDGNNWTEGLPPLTGATGDELIFPAIGGTTTSTTPSVDSIFTYNKMSVTGGNYTFGAGGGTLIVNPAAVTAGNPNTVGFIQAGTSTVINSPFASSETTGGYAHLRSGSLTFNGQVAPGNLGTSTSTAFLQIDNGLDDGLTSGTSGDVYFNGTVVSSATASDSAGATAGYLGGTVNRMYFGGGTLAFNGTAHLGDLGTAYRGVISLSAVSNGILSLEHNNALGGTGVNNAGAGRTYIQSTGSGKVTLQNNITITEGFQLSGRTNNNPMFENTSGDNTVYFVSLVTQNVGNVNYHSVAGSLTFKDCALGTNASSAVGQFYLRLDTDANSTMSITNTVGQGSVGFRQNGTRVVNVVKLGQGTFINGGLQNNYNGTTTIDGGLYTMIGNYATTATGYAPGAYIVNSNGTMQMGNGIASGSIDVGTNATPNIPAFSALVVNNGTFRFNNAGTAGAPVSFASVIQGSGIVHQLAGATNLTGANGAYSGTTSVTGGTLKVGNALALGGGNGAASASTGTIDLNGATVSKSFTLNGTGDGSNGALVNNSGTAATIDNGITASVTSGGTGYSAAPVVTISGGGGAGATATALLGVSDATFGTNSGTTTYSVAPTVTITGGGGNGATAVATLDISGLVSGVTITSPGIGYTTTPTLTFAGGTVIAAGTNPTATGNATNFSVGAISIANAGAGYTSIPTVSFDSGAATATAALSGVNLAGNSSIGGSGTLNIKAPVSGIGGLNKVGAGTTTLSAANTYGGNTTVSGGFLTIASGGSITSPTANLSVGNGVFILGGLASVQNTVNTAGTGTIHVQSTGSLTSNNLLADFATIDGAVTVRTNGGAAGASKIETLNMGVAGKLNLKDNDLVVGTGTVAAVRAAIKTGVAGAAGITSDLPAFGVSTGFGYALGNDSAISPLLAGSLTGQSYDADSVLVKYTYLGDADLDGDSDLNDLGLWAQSFTGDLGNPVTPATYWTSGDFDYDGDTDLNDLGFWAGTFTGDLGGGAGSLIVNAPAGAVAALNSMGITVVPEPSTFVLAGLGLAGLAALRRRRVNNS